MLKQFGAFIAWLSGSLAGVTATLYALGYVATMGADQVLGIGLDFATRAPGFYIGRGGNLILRTLLIAVWPVLGVVIVAAILRWLCVRMKLAERESFSAIRRLADAAAAPLAAVTIAAFVLVGIVFVLKPALNVEGLLFATRIPPAICKEAHGLRRAILSQDRETLDLWFDGLALGAGIVAGLGLIALQHLTRPGQGLWLAIAGVAGLLALVAVPLAYGTMVVQTAPPEVRIEPAPAGAPDTVRLLSRSDGGVLLWLEKERHAQWVSDRGINSLTVVGPGKAITNLHCPEQDRGMGKGN